MQAAIDYLQNQLHVLETNAPINEREGHLAQAALERKDAAEIRDALTLLVNAKHSETLSLYRKNVIDLDFNRRAYEIHFS